ncbi:hypothetical protein [Xenorhabdus hominickii]|uniref:Lipoprotein n=1 Tax=Xenorhabdus hominickii TaxID=351679 RepID=A0A2G0Q465_XENHO|nr:hypothetical protein [Xenorhabdus hominickii]AOM42549.1 hypothetical protein A9255_19555 [Xenorhabdus hominickii]PHM54014.1 lipoprotein [Xenorhabdus hominickii]
MKTFLKLGMLSSAVLLLSACDLLDPDSKKNEFYYSNPTSSSITFKVDDKDYTLEPGANGSVKLSPGMHSIQGSNGNKFSFMVFDINKGGIINPNNYVYYTLSEVYAVEGKADRFKPSVYEVTINGHELEMPLRSSTATVIDGNLFQCSYPLGKPFPAEITTSNKQSVGNIKSKCFDKPELLNYFVSDYGENLAPTSVGDENNDTVNMVFDYTIPKPQFKHDEVQKEAEKLTSLLNKIKESDDPDIHDKLKKEIHQTVIDLVKADTKNATNNTVAENGYYNQFIKQTSNLQSYGILPK